MQRPPSKPVRRRPTRLVKPLAHVPRVIEDNSHNRATIQGWIEKWHPVAARAMQAFAPLFDGKLEDAQVAPLNGVTQKLDEYYRDYLSSMGLRPGG